jgi:hypothetical protein
VLGGMLEEFIFAPRLDNLMNAYCGIEALIRSTSGPDALAAEANVRVVSLYDHEEVQFKHAQCWLKKDACNKRTVLCFRWARPARKVPSRH